MKNNEILIIMKPLVCRVTALHLGNHVTTLTVGTENGSGDRGDNGGDQENREKGLTRAVFSHLLLWGAGGLGGGAAVLLRRNICLDFARGCRTNRTAGATVCSSGQHPRAPASSGVCQRARLFPQHGQADLMYLLCLPEPHQQGQIKSYRT